MQPDIYELICIRHLLTGNVGFLCIALNLPMHILIFFNSKNWILWGDTRVAALKL